MSDHVAEVVVAKPAPELGAHVGRYVGSRFRGLAGGTHQGVASRHLTLVIGLGCPIHVAAMPNPACRPASFPALVGGLHVAPATIRYGPDVACITAEVSAAGTRRLFGLPAGELVSSVVDLTDLLDRRAVELVDRLNDAATWSARFGIVDDVLTAGSRPSVDVSPELSRAWHRLVASAGTIRIAALAQEVGWSRRQLSERFRREWGLTPKAAARVLRFERASQLLRDPEPPGLAEVAAVCGFYDQAHLTNEWTTITGQPPNAWMAGEELPDLQDIGAPPGTT